MLLFIKKVKDCKMFWWRHDLQPFVKLDSLTWKAHCMSWNLKPIFSLDEKLRRIEDVFNDAFFLDILLSVDAIACFNDNRRYGTSLTNHHWPDLHIWHLNLNFFIDFNTILFPDRNESLRKQVFVTRIFYNVDNFVRISTDGSSRERRRGRRRRKDQVPVGRDGRQLQLRPADVQPSLRELRGQRSGNYHIN